LGGPENHAERRICSVFLIWLKARGVAPRSFIASTKALERL
jgi:hypothetical protein